MPSCCNSRRILTETETSLITQKRYNELVEQQKRVDAEIDAQLSRQEDDLRLEEEVLSIDLCTINCQITYVRTLLCTDIAIIWTACLADTANF